jgi:pilus assembly protein Flp/PilA
MSNATSHLYGLLAQVQGRLSGDKERGATAVEYGLLVALIAAIIVGVVAALGIQIQTAFQTVVTALGG